MNQQGKHVIADIWLNEMPDDEEMIEACEAALAHTRMSVALKAVKGFEPQGLTAVWILAESHMSIHTYPENQYISVDIYTCGTEGDPMAAIDHLVSLLDVYCRRIKQFSRGVE